MNFISIHLDVVFVFQLQPDMVELTTFSQNIETMMLAARAPNPRIVEVAPSNWKLMYAESPNYVAAATFLAAQ